MKKQEKPLKSWMSESYKTTHGRTKKLPFYYRDFSLYSPSAGTSLTCHSILNLRTVSSQIIPIFLDAAGESPIVDAFRLEPSYHTPERVRWKEGRLDQNEENVSPTCLVTPEGHRSFVKVVDYKLEDGRVRLFMDETEGLKKKRPSQIKKTKEEVLKKMLRPLAAKAQVGPVTIDKTVLDRAKRTRRQSIRHLMGDVSATEINNAVTEHYDLSCEYSHNLAHTQGGKPLEVSVASQAHNTLRLVAVENPIAEIARTEPLVYQDNVEYVCDETKAPTWVSSSEAVSVTNQFGYQVKVLFPNPQQEITPAREISRYAHTLFSQKPRVKPEANKDEDLSHADLCLRK